MTSLVGSGIRTLGSVAPPLGGRAAVAAFLQTAPRMTLRPADAHVMDAAERGELLLGRTPLVTYRWASDGPTVLLVHGWRGRASQFATLVPSLLADGLQVVAFDAPAHGESPRRPTDIRDWMAAIASLAGAHGPFRVVVGHSFGALAALSTARIVPIADSLVTVAGAGTPQPFLDGFARMTGLSVPAQRRFEAAFRARLGESERSFAERYDALAHPLPRDVDLIAVHDVDDPQVDSRHSEELVGAHPGRATLVLTRGLGHNRVLGAPEVAAAVGALAARSTRHA